MDPKAKWQRIECAGMWSVDVGPFHLDIGERDGHCSLWLTNPLRMIWQHKAATPCDVTDLMRLTEAELARRLVRTAETMEGGELVAHEPAATKPLPPSPPPIHGKSSSSPRFNIGDRVSVYCYTAAKRVFGTVTHYDAATHRYTVDNDLGMWGVFDDDNVKAAFNAAEETCGCGDCSTCLPKDEWERKVTKAAATLERLFKVAAHRESFKVGDLVRVPLDTDEPHGRSVIGQTMSFHEGVYGVRIAGHPGKSYGYDRRFVHPYKLPPISSYADLANVLDELPEGYAVELLQAGDDEPRVYKRHPTGAYVARDASDKEFIISYCCNNRSEFVIRAASARILSPLEVES